MRASYVVATVTAALATVAYFWLQSQALLDTVTDLMFALASGICAILAFLVIRKWGFRGKFGIVHLGLFLGVFLWFLGNATWVVYEAFLQTKIPYPSLADVFYFVAYIPATIGVVQFLWTFRSGFKRQWSLTALSVGLIFLGLTCVFLIGPLTMSAENSLAKIFDVAYPVLDSMLVILALFMFFTFKGGKMAGSWVWISLGVILTAMGGIMFSLGTLQGWYYSGHPVELIQFWGYIALALGFHEQRSGHLV
jgi:hypothetical protein